MKAACGEVPRSAFEYNSASLARVREVFRVVGCAACAASALACVSVCTLAGVSLVPEAAASDYPTIDGRYSETGPIGGGSSFALNVTGRGGVPETGVGAVALNVTVTNPTESSFLTAYPTGIARTNAANLVFNAGQTIPNMVIVKVGSGGQISLFNDGGATDVTSTSSGGSPRAPPSPVSTRRA